MALAFAHTCDARYIPLSTVASFHDQSECNPYFGSFKILLFTCNRLFLGFQNCETALCNRYPIYILQPLHATPCATHGYFCATTLCNPHATCNPYAKITESGNVLLGQPMVCQETILHMPMYTTTLADPAGLLPTHFAGAPGRRLHWAMDLLRWDIHRGHHGMHESKLKIPQRCVFGDQINAFA